MNEFLIIVGCADKMYQLLSSSTMWEVAHKVEETNIVGDRRQR